MDTKTLAAMAAAILATSTWAASPADKSCAAAGCSKKEPQCQPGQDCGGKDTACSKKDAACSKK